MPNSMALTPYGSNGSTDLTMAVLGCGKYQYLEDEHLAARRTPIWVIISAVHVVKFLTSQ